MNCEHRPFAKLALDFQQAAMMIDDVLDDGEPEAGAAQRARPRRVDAVETLGEAREMVARDPLALVADRDRERRRALGRLRYLDGDRGAGAGVFDGIVDQVLE